MKAATDGMIAKIYGHGYWAAVWWVRCDRHIELQWRESARIFLPFSDSPKKKIAMVWYRVIDNNSVVISISLFEEKFPQIQVLKSIANLGYAAAYILGLDQHRNGLCIYHIYWILMLKWPKRRYRFVRALESYCRIMLRFTKDLSGHPKNKFDYAGAEEDCGCLRLSLRQGAGLWFMIEQEFWSVLMIL